jgi:hypothetical protein
MLSSRRADEPKRTAAGRKASNLDRQPGDKFPTPFPSPAPPPLRFLVRRSKHFSDTRRHLHDTGLARGFRVATSSRTVVAAAL